MLYEMRVTLLGVRPAVWRVLQAPSDMDLDSFHRMLQAAMGWEDAHLYQFDIGGALLGHPAQWDGMGIRDARSTTLHDVLGPEKKAITYIYDMGDGWTHRVTFLKALTTEEPEAPRCLRGKGACPPEDCGGPFGYAMLLEALADPNHEDHEERMEWLGRPFDPEHFDLAAVNKEISRLAQPRRRRRKSA